MVRSFTRIAVLFLAIFSAACTGAPFKVMPRLEVPVEKIRGTSSNDKLEFRAELLEEDEAIELFDSNLWLAGIIPVRVAITNRANEVVDIDKVEFKLTDKTGRRFSLIKAKDVMKQLFKYYNIRLYSYEPEKEMRARFLTHSLSLEDRLQPAESLQGLIYFKYVKESSKPEGLQLQFTGLKPEGTFVIALD
jgi:hypothetical protein